MMNKGLRRRTIATLVLLIAPVGALFASSTDPWDTGLSQVVSWLTGPTGTIIGILCLVGGGIALAVTEGQAIKRMFWVIVGIGIALNGTKIVTLLFPGASSSYGGALVWVHTGARVVGALAKLHGGAGWISS